MITGACICNAVRYGTDAQPITTRYCWCRFCQFIATGNAAVSVCFPSAGMTIVGETHDYVSTADSGNIMHRRFCPVCGTQAFGVGRRKYCGDRCAKLAWWRLHRARISEPSADDAALHVGDDDGGASETER